MVIVNKVSCEIKSTQSERASERAKQNRTKAAAAAAATTSIELLYVSSYAYHITSPHITSCLHPSICIYLHLRTRREKRREMHEQTDNIYTYIHTRTNYLQPAGGFTLLRTQSTPHLTRDRVTS